MMHLRTAWIFSAFHWFDAHRELATVIPLAREDPRRALPPHVAG